MKINFIMPGLGDSGGIKVIRNYAAMMNAAGEDVIIYCPIKAYNLHRYESSIKNIMHQIYCTVKTILSVITKAKEEVKWIWSVNSDNIRSADATIATMWATAYDVARLHDKCGKKFYFVQDFEVWDNKEAGINSYKLPLKKIVVSSWINQQLKRELDIGPFPVAINGINTSIFYDKKIRDNTKKDFLMLNHQLEKKGVANGIKVFEKIKEKYPDARLRMFGMCNNKNLPSYVKYYQNPSQKELVNLYCKSNFFIFPSLEEGWGLTPIEAMACGCIVFGTNTGFVLDMGEHKKNMMISEPNNVEAMVENVIDVLNNGLQESISLNAHNTILRLSDIEVYNKFKMLIYNYESEDREH